MQGSKQHFGPRPSLAVLGPVKVTASGSFGGAKLGDLEGKLGYWEVILKLSWAMLRHVEVLKKDKLGRKRGSGSQEQPRMEIRKRDKVGRQGRSGSQEQLRKEITKGDKLGRKRGSSSQEQPRMEIMQRDKLGRRGGSGSQELPRRDIMKGDKPG